MAHAKSLPTKNSALNTIPISKAQAKALKVAKEQAQILAQQQLQQRLLADANEKNTEEIWLDGNSIENVSLNCIIFI